MTVPMTYGSSHIQRVRRKYPQITQMNLRNLWIDLLDQLDGALGSADSRRHADARHGDIDRRNGNLDPWNHDPASDCWTS